MLLQNYEREQIWKNIVHYSGLSYGMCDKQRLEQDSLHGCEIHDRTECTASSWRGPGVLVSADPAVTFGEGASLHVVEQSRVG